MSTEDNNTSDTVKATPTASAAAKPAAKPAKAALPPDPRVVAALANGETIKTALNQKLGVPIVVEVSASKAVPILIIDKAYWVQAVQFLRDDALQSYDYLRMFSGTDYPNYIEIAIHLVSRQHNTALYVKTRTERDLAVVPSLTGLFQGVNWEEREVYDLLGVHFEGHPDLRRIMMWEGWKGYPLRKDYSPFEDLDERGGNV